MNSDKVFDEISTILSDSDAAEGKVSRIKAVIDGHRTLVFKTVKELFDYRFVVPSYQRGYRWRPQQVTDLLNDILDFSVNDPVDDQFYCLQPIIVKKEDGQWRVIDGQQRLTTIYLILTFLGKDQPFELLYKTRDASRKFLEEVNEASFFDVSEQAANIDIHHFREAMKAIKKWFDEDGHSDRKNEWKQAFLFKTRVIWYYPDSDGSTNSDIDIFARINSGKIPLTNSELIRALFIHHSKQSINEEAALLQQNKIAAEWDYIEQQLHDEDFWCFVTLGNPFSKKEYPNRIEFLFDLIEEKTKGGARTDDVYSTFRMYNDRINAKEMEKPQDVATCWQELKNLYYRFHEWYIDRTLYHLTAFARISSIDLGHGTLLDLADNRPQSDLIKEIKARIKIALFEDDIENRIQNATYGDGKTKKVLLLFNVALAVVDAHAAFFNFRSYLRDRWDIEHVRSQTPLSNDRKKWFDAIKEYWGEDKHRELQARMDADGPEQRDEELVTELLELFAETNAEDFTHEIGNLCLLDAGTNRGYGNAPFPVKRKKILDCIKKGVFVPQGTQNVFLKAYTSNTSNMMFWQKEDAEGYEKQIMERISDLLGVKQ